jgi:hypothetical protein
MLKNMKTGIFKAIIPLETGMANINLVEVSPAFISPYQIQEVTFSFNV